MTLHILAVISTCCRFCYQMSFQLKNKKNNQKVQCYIRSENERVSGDQRLRLTMKLAMIRNHPHKPTIPGYDSLCHWLRFDTIEQSTKF